MLYCFYDYQENKNTMNITQNERVNKYKKRIIVVICVFFVLLSIHYIEPSSKNSQLSARSISLSKSSFDLGNNIEKTVYLDNMRKATIAADLGYAIKIMKKKDTQTLEEYYDQYEDPIYLSGGYHAVLREYNEEGLNYCVKYLGKDGKPVMTNLGYSMIMHVFDNEGRINKELYYNEIGEPVCSKNNGWGRQFLYNEDGYISQISFLDEYGNLARNSLGYAIVKRQFYSSGEQTGRVEYEFYFDENGKSICLSLGQCGIHKSYDVYGNTIEVVYLDIDGTPLLTKLGYSKVIRTYHIDNSVLTERYYDLDDKPVSLSDGQYGKKIQNGYKVALDANGNEKFSIKYFINNHAWIVIIGAVLIISVTSVTDRKGRVFILLLYLGVILYFTLLYRDHGGIKVEIQPFRLYRKLFFDPLVRAEIIKNIWLFIPFGTILCQLYPRKSTILISIIVSIVIETIQYYTGSGYGEFDDVISNGLGGAIGYLIGQRSKLDEIKLNEKLLHGN